MSRNRLEDWARSFRRAVRSIATTVHPYVKMVFPNFIAVHYCYILTLIFTTSVVIFPMRNMPYIDALFFSGSAVSQAGLNTIDVNTTKMYQQLAMFFASFLGTPIFVSILVLMLRIYRFETYFDDIEASSKLDHKMRRVSTLTRIRTGAPQDCAPEAEGSLPNDHKTFDGIRFGDLPLPPTKFAKDGPSFLRSHSSDQHHEQSDEDETSSIDSESHTKLNSNLRDSVEPPVQGSSTLFEEQLARPHRSRQRLRSHFDDGLVRGISRSLSRSGNRYASLDGESLKVSQQAQETPYLSWEPAVARNSAIVELNAQQRAELGGVEYRAVKLLLKIICLYYVGIHVLGGVMLTAYILSRKAFVELLHGYGVGAAWWSFFAATSAFDNCGLVIDPSSLVPFVDVYYVPFLIGFLIIIGNTGFPVFLRFIIWLLYKVSSPFSQFNESLKFLLDHPRRCFVLLFPSTPTWCLFVVLIVLNVTDLVLFLALDFNGAYLEQFSPAHRVIAGLFQAVSTRTAGFNIIDITQLHPAMQVSYLIMMYIAALPVAISIRRTNVYEEQSLGVYENESSDLDENHITTHSYMGAHLKNQLSYDLWFIILMFFIIVIAEGKKIMAGDLRFTPFVILFEVVSAYGGVGLSFGYTDVNCSLSGKFTVVSKLAVIAAMIRGRHRGLPNHLDRAIMLPSDKMIAHDAENTSRAVSRVNSRSVLRRNSMTGLDRLRTAISNVIA